jgi:glycyl-tRNA synthetase
MAASSMDEIVALCKRRGLIFPASEIYGGIANTYDYGHYGVLLKNNVIAAWWRAMIQERDDVVALDSAIIQHPRTWEASGHLAGFTDPLVDCRTCKRRFRADHLAEVKAGVAEHELACGLAPSKLPGEDPRCDLTDARAFNLMFQTQIGPVQDEGSTVYLRPETAQGIFLDFKTTLSYARRKPPFGIAQIGKSFRNEITPGNFIFRTLEFEQMEMEFFVPPAEAEQWHEHWMNERLEWYVRLGVDRDRLRLRTHDADELSHYSSATSDIEYLYPIGWSELEGIANRGDFDLTQHAEYSGEKLEYFDPQTRERYVPHVIEPAAGAFTRRSRRSRSPCSRCCARTGTPSSPARSTRTCAAGCSPSTTRAATSASAIGARTRSARRSPSPSTTSRSRTARSRCATATRSSRSGCRSRASVRSSSGGSAAGPPCDARVTFVTP